MDGHKLTDAERRALHEMEDRLRQESERLDRELRTMTPCRGARLRDARGRVGRRLVLALGLLSLALMIVALRTSSEAFVGAFVACWVCTLAGTAVLLFRTPTR
ncbi:DUF3040 domain-containing protein [Streptomyces beihaiensis]|uniref:DUF3040 domain-containing protein n=1 Tax=Streptomyces beihaiensis TaxID=2984495 RepID=A0ABT3TR59_9ACTN|nr:DUF3040 domain-containing protein [Streptomyces beihaiensis]MCX3059529.1 DUF3040 domain-containing protein [Streptomyces beihaiensis]